VKHGPVFWVTDLVNLEGERMSNPQRETKSSSDSDDKDVPERNPSPVFEAADVD